MAEAMPLRKQHLFSSLLSCLTFAAFLDGLKPCPSDERAPIHPWSDRADKQKV